MKALKGTAFALLGAALAMAIAARLAPRTAKDIPLGDGDRADLDGRRAVYLDSFTVPVYPSGKPKQYISAVKTFDHEEHRLSSAEISVNHPLRWDGWWVYQMSYGMDEDGYLYTVLHAVRDSLLPLAAVAGALMILGALLLCFVPREQPPSAPTRLRVALSWAAALAVTALPAFIIGRAVMRPEPVPALQSVLMAPHVAAYAGSYLLLLFAAFGIGRRAVPVGFLLMTLGLVIGAAWGKVAWGDWWQFDPKENWSLATWCAFAVHLALPSGGKWSRTFLWIGAVLIVVTLTWVNFSRFASGLHSYA